MTVPTNAEILSLLDLLEHETADDLEGPRLEFKPWTDSKQCMRVAVEYAVCFANAEGGVIVFGVRDQTRGRVVAIHGAGRCNVDTWRRTLFAGVRPGLSVEVDQLTVPEGTGKLVIVRVPRGDNPPYCTADGLFKKRVGRNCMPLDAASIGHLRVASGAVDWSGEQAEGVRPADLDPVEISRARTILRSRAPGSELLRLEDQPFLDGLEATRGGRVTHAGLLLFGTPDVIAACVPQAQLHYVYQLRDTEVARNDVWRVGLLQMLSRIEDIFSSPTNPEQELPYGLFKIRIPAFPLDVVREAVMNAITHRDYTNPGEVLIRHGSRELVVTSPGGFVPGISLDNILQHEPVARNRTLANAFLKLRLVESAGTGRRRMFVPMLSFGKRAPRFETDGHSVTLRLFDGAFDEKMAKLVAKWNSEGREVGLDALLVLSYLKEHPFVDTRTASELLQLGAERARSVLDQLSLADSGILERRGRSRSATFSLTKGVARDLVGPARYTQTRGLRRTRYAELVREYLADHGSISNRELRELLGLGDSASAQVEASVYLRRWSAEQGFLDKFGRGRPRYRLRERTS